MKTKYEPDWSRQGIWRLTIQEEEIDGRKDCWRGKEEERRKKVVMVEVKIDRLTTKLMFGAIKRERDMG